MTDMRLWAAQSTIGRTADGQWIGARATRDGALFTAPWFQALVFEGRVFAGHAGTVTTGIAGHAAIDADQPEFAIRATSDNLRILPLHLQAHAESGSTTLGVHELMYAASNIDVGAGTSVAVTEFNMNLASSRAASAVALSTYSANGTDPLTSGNYIELGRSSGLLDSDAATSGLKGLDLVISAADFPMPVIAGTGSIVGYGGGSTGAVFFFTGVWAEFDTNEI